MNNNKSSQAKRFIQSRSLLGAGFRSLEGPRVHCQHLRGTTLHGRREREPEAGGINSFLHLQQLADSTKDAPVHSRRRSPPEPSPLTFHQPLDEATEAVKLQHRSPHSQAQKQVHGLYPQILQAILMSVYSLGPRTLPTVPHSTKRIILTAGSEGNLYNTQ